MADQITVHTNLPEFKKQMNAFAYDLQRKIGQSGVNAAAQVFKKRAVALAPALRKPDKRRVAGQLRRAMYVYRRRNPQAGTVLYSVGFRQGAKAAKAKGGSRDAFYGRFLELGWVARGSGKRVRGGARSKALQRKRNLAGGATRYSKPFLLPSFQQVQPEALAAFNRKMTERIEKASRDR